ncbi:Major facilitator superfamily domain general substrate transporter [Penicillium macrosclerotiorum]|uniref:Major facilitator superfamily domain general substrate transporter n=1 Tax=Penicillium macrosclerotiorum TaxID=303699 RepID=UPI00254704D7|nr:Major facilitator superfamily domain general substrate transporter [Penicillium macrosclerotiorum]KAJ5689917.1 Major facilitator superfamily domain general substrate transporter [Penicillium macrosclerotiorum]
MASERPSLSHDNDAPVKPAIVAGIISTWVATFLAAADSTITSTLSATIANEFQSLALISWLGTAYLIGMTATQPLSGKLTDIFGRRISFCCASGLFTVGNLVSGLSHSKLILIVARVLSGIGGGGCISIATFIASDHIPLRRRGLWQGIGAVNYTTGMAVGAAVGGVVNDAAGWRWAFLGIAPISFAAGIGVAIFVPEHRKSYETPSELFNRVDLAGAATLVASLVLLLVGLNHDGPQLVNRVFEITIPPGLALFAAFLLIETRWAKEPIIPLSLFRRRTVVATCLTAWFMSMSYYALSFYIPLYFQMLGYSTGQIGLRLLPDFIATALGSFLVGLLIRITGQYGFFRYSMPVLLVGSAAGFGWISTQTHWVLPESYLALKGFGMGGTLTMLLLALLHEVPHDRHATATSALYAFRSTGASVGLSSAGAIFNSQISQSASKLGVPCKIGEPCYMDALHRTFKLALGLAAAGLVSALFIRAHSTHEAREAGSGGTEGEQ